LRSGFRVWDVDTHVRPTLENLTRYYDPQLRSRVTELDTYVEVVKATERATRTAGNHDYAFPGYMVYRRVLGQDVSTSAPQKGSGKKFMGSKAPSAGTEDGDARARLRDMDEEGVDVQVLVPGFPNPVTLNDPELQIGFMRAYNRYVADFCSTDPKRLKALLPVIGNGVEACVDEIKRYSSASWMVGVWPMMDNDTPIDHPDLNPIWEAIDANGKVVIHHSLSNAAPYYPGYRDLWDSRFLGRAASHPWGAMRALGAFIGGGLLERYSQLRFGVLECGCGWLPFWSRRLDDQVEYIGGTAALQNKISEQMAGGRFFASLEMAEGEDMIQMVIDFLGEDVLMYASDYPHPECQYPGSVDHFLGWSTIDERMRKKLLFENAAKCFGEP
jgi:predicted TIM-barrel fold metal-dependent hydrolase